MSRTTALGVFPHQRPVTLAEYSNGHGWAPSIWDRLLKHRGEGRWILNDVGLKALWDSIEELPEWQQAPLVLTFDTGIIPCQAYEWAADYLDEFERRLPASPDHVNHVPAVAELLRSRPEVPFFGVWSTSVTDNPFDPWDHEADGSGSGILIQPGSVYVLARHREMVDFASLLSP